MKRLYEETKHDPWGIGVYYDYRKKRYIRHCQSLNSVHHRGSTKWLRRQANKKIRRSGEAYRHSQDRKVFDYWQEPF